MRIKVAKFLEADSVPAVVTPAFVCESGEYETKYRGHLFCNEEGCAAQIEFVNKAGAPYFRTWKGSSHSPDCIFSFERDPSLGSRHGEAVRVGLSDDHIQRSLKRGQRKLLEDKGITPPTRPRRSNGKSTSHTRQTVGDGVRLVGAVDPDVESAEEHIREPNISQRSCSELTPRDIGECLCLRGTVKNATDDGATIQFHMEAGNHPPVTVYFFNSFKRNPQHYRWIEATSEQIRNGELSDLPISCVAVCEYTEDSGYRFQVMSGSDINLSGSRLAAFIRDYNNS